MANQTPSRGPTLIASANFRTRTNDATNKLFEKQHVWLRQSLTISEISKTGCGSVMRDVPLAIYNYHVCGWP